MIIKADQEGLEAIAELVDVVLKAVGLKAHAKVGKLLSSITQLEDPKPLQVVKEIKEIDESTEQD